MDGCRDGCRDGWIDGMIVCVFMWRASPSAPKEEYLITDVAYCEQAVIFLKQAKLEQDAGQRRKEEGTLPVSTDARSCRNDRIPSSDADVSACDG